MSDMFNTQQLRWLACTRRNPSAHSSFLYGVRSTKIYCRPTCTARLARRANVVFYDNYEAAQRDGFRPCKRCKPDDALFRGDAEDLVTRILALLCMKADDPTFLKGGLKELATMTGVTPSYLCRVFKKTMGVTIGSYMKDFESTPWYLDTPISTFNDVNLNEMVPIQGFPMDPAYFGGDAAKCDADITAILPPQWDQDIDDWLAVVDLSKDSQYSCLWKDDLLLPLVPSM